MPERKQALKERPLGEHVKVVNIHHSCCCTSYKWKIGRELADRSGRLKHYHNSSRCHGNITLDRNYTCLDLARMICFLQYGHYPLYKYQDVKTGGPSLEAWLRRGAGQQIDKPCRDAKEPCDRGHLHLRMLRVADYYKIPDLTKHCLSMLEEHARKEPSFVWEIREFIMVYAICTGSEDLVLMIRRIFAEHAKRFVKEERFEKAVKSDPGFAWAVMCLMARKMR